MGLGTVLDQRHTRSAAQVRDRSHVSQLAIEVGCNDRFDRFGRKHLGKRRGRQVQRVLIHVNIQRLRPNGSDGGAPVEPRIGHCQHALARADIQAAQGQFKRVRPIGNANGVANAHIRRKRRFKSLHPRAQHVAPTCDCLPQHSGQIQPTGSQLR